MALVATSSKQLTSFIGKPSHQIDLPVIKSGGDHTNVFMQAITHSNVRSFILLLINFVHIIFLNGEKERKSERRTEESKKCTVAKEL